MMGPRFRATLLGLWVMGIVAPTQAALFEDDEARRAILDLRQRLESLRMSTETLRSEVNKASAGSGKSQDELQSMRRGLLDLQNQIESLRSDLSQSKGDYESLLKSLAEWQREQKDKIQAQEERLRKLEPVKVSLDGREFLAEPSELRDYDMTLEIFRKGEYAQAVSGLTDFLRKYPQTGYKPSALFWLGNAQYAVRDYKEAIASFRALVAMAPHPRVAESLLAIANCQIELKDLRAARKALEDVIKAYPESEAAGAAKQRLAKLK